MANYTVGDSLRVTGTWYVSGQEIDDAVSFRVKSPAGVVTTYAYGVDAELVRESAGVYYVDVSLDASGKWYVRFESTGDGQAAREQPITVDKSHF